MEKDIDDLLDEVETKFVKKEKSSRPKSGIKSSLQQENSGKNTSQEKRSQIDDAIDDILDLDLNDEHPNSQVTDVLKNPPQTVLSSRAGASDATRKCFPVFLGGSAQESGICTTVHHRTCNQLRCTACDFRVSFFDDFSWHKDTSYLFLRNNVPDFQKLKSKLSRKKGCRAYCCQCSWRNITSLSELTDPNIKWVCGKHAS